MKDTSCSGRSPEVEDKIKELVPPLGKSQRHEIRHAQVLQLV